MREAQMLRGPHLMLADIGDEVRVVARGLADRADDEARRELDPILIRGEARPHALAVEPGAPLGPRSVLEARREREQHRPGVGDDADRGRHVLSDLRRVDVGVDDLRLRREGADLPGHAIVEAQPDAQDHVRVVHHAVRVRAAVHPEHSRREPVVLGERADAEQRGDDRGVDALGERAELAMSPCDTHPDPR